MSDPSANMTTAEYFPDRGYLLEEPCRHCYRTGGVYFVVDDSPFGRNTAQVVACDKCKNSWCVDGPLA